MKKMSRVRNTTVSILPVTGSTYSELVDAVEKAFPDMQDGDYIEVYEGLTVFMWGTVKDGEYSPEWHEDFRYSEW